MPCRHRPETDKFSYFYLYRTFQIPGSDDFNVVFVGAGNIMFGLSFSDLLPRCNFLHILIPKDPMKVLGTILSVLSSAFSPRIYTAFLSPCHSLYSKLGPRLKVVALIDPNIERASSVLYKKRETFVRSAYENTRIFKTLEDFVQSMLPRDRPRAVIVGSPPMFRGTTKPGRDIELQILSHFPGVALFIEKPIATGPEDEIPESFKVCQAIVDSGAVCSVG